MAAGVEAIFLKRESFSDFSGAIPRVLAGERFLGPGISELLAGSQAGENLTARERQILSLATQGWATKRSLDGWV